MKLRAAILGLLSLLLVKTAAWGQFPLPSPHPTCGSSEHRSGKGLTLTRGTAAGSYDPFASVVPGDIDAGRRQRLFIYFNAQTQKKNTADADRLLVLARELNGGSEASKGTVAELKKVEEIEKLAKRVRERLVPFQ